MHRILIVDDHAMRTLPDWEVTGEASNGREREWDWAECVNGLRS